MLEVVVVDWERENAGSDGRYKARLKCAKVESRGWGSLSECHQ